MLPHHKSEVEIADEGRYLYCVADNGELTNLGNIGLDGKNVYTISFDDVCAVIHDCPSEPYKSEDNEVVKKWVLSHEHVVEAACESFGAVLPFGFDTIIKGEKGINSEENVKNWLRENSSNLREKMNKIRGKAEFGIQIFWDLSSIADKIRITNQEIVNLNKEIESKPRGMGYMFRQKLEVFLKKEIEKAADIYFKDFYARIKERVDEIKIEKIKKIEGTRQMLMNLSCLINKEKSKELGEMLERINQEEGFAVRFTGPWPPYSFVVSG